MAKHIQHRVNQTAELSPKNRKLRVPVAHVQSRRWLRKPLGASPERNNMPILLFGILIGAIITAVVVMIFLVFAAKSYKQFSKIMDRLIDWAERF